MEIKEVTTGSKLESFFTTLNQLITKGEIRRGKDFKLVEETNGKVLYLHMESIYAMYCKAVGLGSARLVDIRYMLNHAPFFVKYARSVQFEWKDPINESIDNLITKNISAPMFCYDRLKEKYNIDLERYSIEEFEAAMLAKGLFVENIDEIKLKGKFVSMAIGYIDGQKHTWNSEGKCFMKNGAPNERYNLTFE